MKSSPSTLRAGLALLALSTVQAASPTLDLSNGPAIKAAAGQALTNLLKYYSPNKGGNFDTVQTPWHESGMIWNTFYDYTAWGGDPQFNALVTSALSNLSYGPQQDFLNGQQSQTQGLLGKWNDDILWPAQAIATGGMIYGPTSNMPGSNGNWITAPQKTLDEVYDPGQRDDLCGGGIYWSRNRQQGNNDYKSVITHLEYIQTAARTYMANQNETLIDNAVSIIAWLFTNGLGSIDQGLIYDGVSASNCLSITGSQWSYNYGELLGALAWMHKATGNSTYLDMASPFLQTAISKFAPNGVIEEICEPAGTCNRDQQGFKAILVRNLAYLVRETTNQNDINSIKSVIGTTVAAMVKNSCDTNWNCGGNWTTDSGPVLYVRSQHVSAALLVASLGIFQDSTGPGLMPANIDAPQVAATFNTTTGGSSSKCTTNSDGTVTSCPLGSTANQLSGWNAGVVVGLLLTGIALYV